MRGSPASYGFAQDGRSLMMLFQLFQRSLRKRRAREQARTRWRPVLEQLETREVPAVMPTFVEYGDWGSGFTAGITLTNNGTQPVSGWDLQFDFSPAITQIWNAQLVAQGNGRCEIRDAGWDAIIRPGQSVGFGFNGAPGHVTAGPTNYGRNRVPPSGNQPPHIPTPASVAPTSPVATNPRLN